MKLNKLAKVNLKQITTWLLLILLQVDPNRLTWHHEGCYACRKYTPYVSIRTQFSVNIQGKKTVTISKYVSLPPTFTTAKNEHHRRSTVRSFYVVKAY